jgi:hypothetical protein
MTVRVKIFKSTRANHEELEEQVNGFLAGIESTGGRAIGTQLSSVLENLDVVLFAMVTYEAKETSARLGAMTAAIDDPAAVQGLAEAVHQVIES